MSTDGYQQSPSRISSERAIYTTLLADAPGGLPRDGFNGHFRNNLHLGPDKPGRGIYRFANATSYSTYDYNGYRPNPNATDQFFWRAPRSGMLWDYDPSQRAQAFRSLAELSAATGQERHGVELDFDIFENLRPPDPAKPHAVYYASDLDFRLKPGSKAVDAGVLLPNVNDDFTGRAPDLGAYESGKPLPVYGPRGGSQLK